MRIIYPLARILGELAEAKAISIGVPMAIAITDERGDTVFFGCMDNALPASREIAPAKAATAARLRMSTEEVGRLAQPGGKLYGIQHALKDKIVVFGGGIPLCINGNVAGAVGISGGTVEEDIKSRPNCG